MPYSKITTFSTMAEQIIDLLSKGDKPNDSPLDERVVMRWLRQSAARHINGSMGTAWANGERIADAKYIATFNNIEVKVDTDTNENYCDLPVFGYFHLPNHAEIQRAAPKLQVGYGKAMIPINPHEMDIYGPLEAGYLEGQWWYMPDRFKLIFGKRNNKTLKELGILAVQVKMISVDPETVGNEDPIPISEDLQLAIIMDVVQILSGAQDIEADMLTNTNPNT